MVHPRQLAWTLIGIAALTVAPASAQDSVELVPEDTCIIELTLPEGSTVKLNGQDQKTARQFTYNALTANKLHSIPLEILYPSSKVSKHLLLLKAGHRIRLAAVDPEAEVPELVLQATLSHTPGGDISPDGTMIALGSSTGVTTIYDVSTGRLLRTIRGFREDCTPQFVAGGKNLLVTYFDTYLPLFSFGGGDGVSLSVKVLYSTETGEILAEFDDPSISTAISPLGSIFAFSKDFKSGTGKWAPKQTPYVLVVDSDTGKVIHKFGPYEVASNLHLSFSSDGKQLGVGDSHDIDIYDTDSWRKTRVYHYGGSNNESIDTSFLSPEGTHLHVVTQKYNPENQGPDYTTRMIDVSSRRQLWSRSGRQSSGHIGRIFSPDNKHAILGNTVVDVLSGRQAYKSSGNGQRFLPSGELLVVHLPTESQLEPCFSGSKAKSVGLQLESDNSLDFEFLELLGILGSAFSRCEIVDIKTGTHKKSHGKIQTISRDATMALVVDMPSLSLTASASEIVEYVKTVHKGLMPMLLINLQTEKPVWRLSDSSFSASQTHLLPGGKVIAYSSLQEVLLRDVV